MLTEKEVTEYQENHKKIYWTEISQEEAYTQWASLVQFLEAISKVNKDEQ